MRARFYRLGWLVLLALVPWWTGCQTYSGQSDALRGSWAAGDPGRAATLAQQQQGRDDLLWRLEEGAAWRAAGQVENSVRAFAAAEERIAAWDRQAEVKVGAETAAFLTNANALPYRGRHYDRILLNTYQALNYLEQGRPDAARVELNRALERQRQAVRDHAEAIAEEQSLLRQRQAEDPGGDVSWEKSREVAQSRLPPPLPALPPEVAAYADFVNPFTVWLDGWFFLWHSTGASDYERARVSLQRVAEMAPDNPFVAEDLATLLEVREGRARPAVTYVIFESGLGPRREEMRADLPVFLISEQLAYVGAAFPRLVFSYDYTPPLAVSSASASGEVRRLASMDAVVAREFRLEWPSILTRTILSSAGKAALLYAAQSAVRNEDEAVRNLVAIVGGLASYAITQADLRTWQTIPREFHYGRWPTPPDGRLVLRCGDQRVEVAVEPGRASVVYVKSIQPSAPLRVSQFTLP